MTDAAPFRLVILLAVLLTVQEGVATWYGPGFIDSPTASGVIYAENAWLVAHRDLPLGSQVLIVSRCGTVVAPVLDRGPFPWRVEDQDWILDVSPRVGRVLFCSGLGVTDEGVAWGMEEIILMAMQ